MSKQLIIKQISPELGVGDVIEKANLKPENFSKIEASALQKDIGVSMLFALKDASKGDVTDKIESSMARLFFMITGFFNDLMASNIGEVLVRTRDCTRMIGSEWEAEEKKLEEEFSFLPATLNDYNWNIVLQIKVMKQLLSTRTEETGRLLEELYQTFYKKEYKSLKRFRKIKGDDIAALSGMNKNEFSLSDGYQLGNSVSRITTMGLVLGNTFDADVIYCHYVLEKLYEHCKKARPKYPNWKKIPEGSLIKTSLEQNEMLGSGQDIFSRIDEEKVGEIEDDYERCKKVLELTIYSLSEQVVALMEVLNQVLNSPAPIPVPPLVKKEEPEVKPEIVKIPKSEIEKENEELKKKIAKLEQDYQYIGSLYEKEKEKSRALESQIKDNELEHMEVIKLREELYRITEEDLPVETATSLQEKETFIKNKRVIIIGGSENWLKKVRDKFEDWKFLSADASSVISGKVILNSDYVYFFTDVLSHSVYYKYMRYVRDYDLEFGYLHSVNIDATINQIYEDLKERK